MSRALYVLGLISAGSLALGTAGATGPHPFDPRTQDEAGSILAWFDRRSYAPGDRATLHFLRGAPARARLTVLRIGPKRGRRSSQNDMAGAAVRIEGPRVARTAGVVSLRVGPWPSGLYAARVTASGGRRGFAPFVVTAGRKPRSRVVVVMPTTTWQAYNFRDADRNGVGDTWYADPSIPMVELARPYMHGGVPPYRPGFMHWLERMRPRPDFMSDDDLDSVSSGESLLAAYDLVVFAGHEEYVTSHVYDVVKRYRDLGGNLAFLSSNTFFYRVRREGSRLRRLGRWIDLGRVDARLTGVHYVGWNERRFPNRPYVATDVSVAPWFFRGTGLEEGEQFGSSYGVEIDQVSADSPKGTVVLARIPELFGRGRSATMTYYETAGGAKVFAAGAMNFDQPQSRVCWQLLTNLWRWMLRP
jgi:hypothetical protein